MYFLSVATGVFIVVTIIAFIFKLIGVAFNFLVNLLSEEAWFWVIGITIVLTIIIWNCQ